MDNYRAAKIRKRHRLKLSNKKLPVSVIAAFIVGILSVILFVVMCIISAVNAGHAGQIAGVIPLCALIINITAFLLSYENLKREDVKKGPVSIAAFLNGGMVIVYLILYLIGAYMMFR